MQRATFQQGMAYLAAAYGTELSKERAAVYWDQLGGLRDEPFMAAVRVAVNHGERFPTVAQLRVHYLDALRREQRSAVCLPGRRVQDRELWQRRFRELRSRLAQRTRDDVS